MALDQESLDSAVMRANARVEEWFSKAGAKFLAPQARTAAGMIKQLPPEMQQQLAAQDPERWAEFKRQYGG